LYVKLLILLTEDLSVGAILVSNNWVSCDFGHKKSECDASSNGW